MLWCGVPRDAAHQLSEHGSDAAGETKRVDLSDQLPGRVSVGLPRHDAARDAHKRRRLGLVLLLPLMTYFFFEERASAGWRGSGGFGRW